MRPPTSGMISAMPGMRWPSSESWNSPLPVSIRWSWSVSAMRGNLLGPPRPATGQVARSRRARASLQTCVETIGQVDLDPGAAAAVEEQLGAVAQPRLVGGEVDDCRSDGRRAAPRSFRVVRGRPLEVFPADDRRVHFRVARGRADDVRADAEPRVLERDHFRETAQTEL